jgi:putative flippase GtrA
MINVYEFFKYNLVGIANTLVGFSIVFSLMFFGLSAEQSNMIGYAIGAVLSLYLNSRYTFKSKLSKILTLKFFGVLLFSYLLNFLVLKWFLSTEVDPYLAQFFSAIVYTISSFILMKVFVFNRKVKKHPTPPLV